ncbi:MAG: hypothetical protein ACXQTX_05970 [Candidatus Syntropharchaeia archaeon]
MTENAIFLHLYVERNKIVHLKVYPARNALTAYSFLKEVLKICEVEEKSLVESAFSSFKRAKIFFCLEKSFRMLEQVLQDVRILLQCGEGVLLGCVRYSNPCTTEDSHCCD